MSARSKIGLPTLIVADVGAATTMCCPSNGGIALKIVDGLERWIADTLALYSERRRSCVELLEGMRGFYPISFLAESYFVVVDDIPRPHLDDDMDPAVNDFLAMDIDGITYKDTYFVKPSGAQNLELHCHELVHVAQWKHLGVRPFIDRYLTELRLFHYEEAPLEQMAYAVQHRFSQGGHGFNVPDWIARNL